MADKTIASVTVHGASDYPPEGRKMIADWLRERADFVESEGANFAKRFRSQYIVSGQSD